MNYELAKQLKEAGFPQRFKEGRSYAEPNEKFEDILTLSELIKDCGDRLTILENYGDGWNAYEERIELIGIETQGKTPEEAVARLWIEINKKK